MLPGEAIPAVAGFSATVILFLLKIPEYERSRS
jgi:hypothetical protein